MSPGPEEVVRLGGAMPRAAGAVGAGSRGEPPRSRGAYRARRAHRAPPSGAGRGSRGAGGARGGGGRLGYRHRGSRSAIRHRAPRGGRKGAGSCAWRPQDGSSVAGWSVAGWRLRGELEVGDVVVVGPVPRHQRQVVVQRGGLDQQIERPGAGAFPARLEVFAQPGAAGGPRRRSRAAAGRHPGRRPARWRPGRARGCAASPGRPRCR